MHILNNFTWRRKLKFGKSFKTLEPGGTASCAAFYLNDCLSGYVICLVNQSRLDYLGKICICICIYHEIRSCLSCTHSLQITLVRHLGISGILTYLICTVLQTTSAGILRWVLPREMIGISFCFSMNRQRSF